MKLNLILFNNGYLSRISGPLTSGTGRSWVLASRYARVLEMVGVTFGGNPSRKVKPGYKQL